MIAYYAGITLLFLLPTTTKSFTNLPNGAHQRKRHHRVQNVREANTNIRSPTLCITRHTLLLLHPSSNDNQNENENSKSKSDNHKHSNDANSNNAVESLKEQARKLRLEAELMDQKLTQSKLSALELQVEQLSDRRDDDDENAPNSTVIAEQLRDDILNLRLRLEGKPPIMKSTMDDAASSRRMQLRRTVTKPGVRISKLTPEQLQQNVELFVKLPGILQTIIRKTSGLKGADNGNIGANELIARIHERESRLLSDPDQCNESKDFFFRFFGTKDVKDQLENLYQRSMHYKQLYPEVVRSACRKQLRKQDVEYFHQNVLNKNTFVETSEPEIVPGGCYIIRGVNRMEDGDASSLIEAIDEDLASSRVAESLQFCYVEDLEYEPPALSNDDKQKSWYANSDLDEKIIKKEPILLITGPDLTPPRYVRNFALTSLAFATTGFFSAGVWVGNGEMEERIQNLNLAGQAYQDKIVDSNIGGVFVSMCFLFLVHDLAHKFVASRKNFDMSVPTILPFTVTGNLGAVTRLKSSPLDRASLFDFALSGPLVGLLFSLGALFVGLTLTVAMDGGANTGAYDFLPALSAEFIRQSALVSGIISAILGPETLAVTDPATTLIPMHPFAVTGVIGVLINSLNLLPLGSSDGGRIAQAVFGREFARNSLFISYLCLFLSYRTDLVIPGYILYNFVLQSEAEIPCRNEVDGLDAPRLILAAFSLFVAFAGCTPAAFFSQ